MKNIVIAVLLLTATLASAWDFKSIPTGGNRVGLSAEENEVYALEKKLVEAYNNFTKTNVCEMVPGGLEQNFKGLYESGTVGAIFALTTPSWWRTYGTGAFIKWTHRTICCRYIDPVTKVETKVRFISQGQADARWSEFHTWVCTEQAQKIIRGESNFACRGFGDREG